MGQIKLSKYIKEIEKEFESGQYTQVIAHGRQILKQYPRYMAAYRLIGMALMEQQAYTEAEDIFQRVLSIDISDFVSHKSLAEIMAETGRIEQSIWHIEHAFEIDPNHADVIHLREQYYRRAGVPAPVVNGMPLASVARLYVKSGIYDQAIEELNRMLDHNQDRLDWKAILAVAYWRDGRNAEALQLGETVLEILPNNYQARMILGDIWWQNDRQDIASQHLDTLQQILLLDQEEKENYPIAGQVLEQTDRIPLTYMVDRLSDSDVDDWSSHAWDANASSSPLNNDSDIDAEYSESEASQSDNLDVVENSNSLFDDEVGNELESENVLDNLFESLDDDPSLVDSDLLSNDAEWEENRLGTGLLDSFAAEIESFSDESLETVNAEAEPNESFSWLGSDEENELFQTADNPDPISDSELNELPDISSLFDDDFADELKNVNLEDQIPNSDALSVDDIGDTLVDEPSATLQSNNDEWDLDSISADDDELADIFDNSDDDASESLFEDSELASTGALIPLPDDDDLDAFSWPEPDQSATETDLKAMFDAPEEVENFELDSSIDEDSSDDQTGFTGWLEDEDVSGEEDVQDEYDPTADALSGGLFEFLSDKDNQLNPLPEPKETFDSIDDEFEGLLDDETFTEDAIDNFSNSIDSIDVDGNDSSDESEEDDNNDLFDTSWLDAEPSEEIDLLEDSEEALDLKSFSDSLNSEFDFLDQDDEDSKFKPQDDFDSLFDSPVQSSELPDVLEDVDVNVSKPEQVLAQQSIDDLVSDTSGDLEFLNEFDIVAEDGTSEFDWISDSEQEDEDLFDSDTVLDQTVVDETLSTELPEANDVDADLEKDLFVEDLSFLDGVLDFPDEDNDEHETNDSDSNLETSELSFLDQLDDSSKAGDAEEQLDEQNEDLSFLDSLAEVDQVSSDSALESFSSNESPDDSDIMMDQSSDDLQQSDDNNLDSSAIDWLIPEQESSDDLSWLSLLEDATTPNETLDTEEPEEEMIWTSDLSAAANPILSPNFDSEENSTEDPDEEPSPDWLIEFPEYNDVNLQTGRLEDEPFHDTGRFTKQILPEIGQPHETESRVSETAANNDDSEEQEFDPVIFRESSAIKLPDWLSDTTESASLGFEPDPVLDAELDVFEDVPQPDKVLEKNAEKSDVDDRNYASDGALLFPEDDLDMERDKDGNPIPPESQDLEDTLNWLEELAILDVHGDEASIVENAQSSDLTVGEELVEDEPISDIFSGGSSLHAFADLEDIGEVANSDVTDAEDVSEETLTWLDDLFTPTEEPSSEFPASTWDDDAADELTDSIVDEPLLDADIDSLLDGTSTSDLESEISDLLETPSEPVSDIEVEASKNPEKSERTAPSMFGEDDVHVSDEDISQAAESGDMVPGMEDLPDDPDALMAWLDLDSSLEDVAESLDLIEVEEGSLDDVLNESISDVDESDLHSLKSSTETVIEEIDESPSKAPSMFGDDDIHVSEEEISQAAEFGDMVPGMEDMPDDPDALMAWLDMGSEESSSIDSLEAADLAQTDEPAIKESVELAEAVVPGTPDTIEAEPKSAAPSMFGDDDIHVSEEEISQAAEFGDMVPGMEDMPDDPDALMAWLDMGSEESSSIDSIEAADLAQTDEPVIEESAELAEAVAPDTIEAEPKSAAPSMFGDDDIHVSEEEISQAAEFGDMVPGMEDMPDDPDALMAWLDMGSEESSSIDSLDSIEAADLALTDEPVIEESVEPAEAVVPDTIEAEPKSAAPSMFGDDDIHVSEEEISQAAEFGDMVPGMEDMPDDPDALMAWLNLAPDDLDNDSDFSDTLQTSDADLIVADLGDEGLEVEKAISSNSEPVTDELDNLFDELAGNVEGDISDEDLIFGDLGTGRLSGTDWLDRMTFDSDPALLGDVPTIPPHLAPEIEETDSENSKIVEAGVENTSDDSLLAEPPVKENESLGSVEELPDDPDEFLKILESNVTDSPLDIDPSSDLDLGEIDSTVPDWLQVESDNADSNLGWLEDASPSGVFNWLEAEEGIEDSSVAVNANDADKVVDAPSMFDSDPIKTTDDSSSSLSEFQSMLKSGENIPEVIRKIRSQLEIRNDSTLQKLLGDAYMETGQLQDALDAYRQAQRLL